MGKAASKASRNPERRHFCVCLEADAKKRSVGRPLGGGACLSTLRAGFWESKQPDRQGLQRAAKQPSLNKSPATPKKLIAREAI